VPASEPAPIAQDAVDNGRPARTPRPTFLRLQEVDAALRNPSLDQASDEDEALAWVPVLRSISSRAARLADALERLAGAQTAAVRPVEEAGPA
jgi:hypothetical protein